MPQAADFAIFLPEYRRMKTPYAPLKTIKQFNISMGYNLSFLSNNIIQLRLNRGCFVYMFSFRFSGNNFFINLRWQFRVRKILAWTLNFSYKSFSAICSLFILCFKLLFRLCVIYYLGCSFIKDCSLTAC